MKGGLWALGLGSGLCVTAASAQVEPCEAPRGLAHGAIAHALQPGMLGAARHACPRNEVGLAGEVYLDARPAELYGHLRGAGRVNVAVRATEDLEVWGSWELLRHEAVLSAVTTSTATLGDLSLGATGILARWDRTILALSGRIVTPNPWAYRLAWPLAADLGLVLEARLDDTFRLHANLGALTRWTVSSWAEPLIAVGGRASGGIDLTLAPWIALVLEAHVGAGFREALDFVAVAGAARFAIDDALGIDLGVLMPLAGAEPGLGTAQFALSWREPAWARR